MRQELCPGWKAAGGGSGRTDGRTDGRTALCPPAWPALRANLISCAEQLFLRCRTLDFIGCWIPSHPGLPPHPGLPLPPRSRCCCASRLPALPPLQPLPRRFWLHPRPSSPSLLLKRVDAIPSLEYFSFLALYFSLFAAWGQSHTGCCRQPGKAASRRVLQLGQVREGE